MWDTAAGRGPFRPGKAKSDRGFWLVFIALVAVCLLLPLSMILFSYHLKFDFQHFLGSLSEATVSSYRGSGLQVTDGEEVYTLYGDNVYVPYLALSTGGMGKPESHLPDDSETVSFVFDNGARMQIWNAPISDSLRGRAKALVVYFEDIDGSTYLYSTEGAFFSSIQNLCYTRYLQAQRKK